MPFTKENAATLGRKGGQNGKGHKFAHGKIDPKTLKPIDTPHADLEAKAKRSLISRFFS